MTIRNVHLLNETVLVTFVRFSWWWLQETDQEHRSIRGLLQRIVDTLIIDDAKLLDLSQRQLLNSFPSELGRFRWRISMLT
jgi:hypothetical protein